MPHRFHIPEGGLSGLETVEVFLIGTIEFLLLTVALLLIIHVTLGFGTWTEFAYT